MADVRNIGKSSGQNAVQSAEQAPEKTGVDQPQQATQQQAVAEDTDRTVDALKKQSTESKGMQELQGKMQGRALDKQLDSKQPGQNPAGLQFHTGINPTGGVQLMPPSQVAIDKLGEAARKGDLVELKKLIAQGVDINGQDSGPNGSTALIEASIHGHKHIVEELMARGANVNQQAKNGQTAIMHASYRNREDVAKLLIHNYKADVNIRDTAGRTALIYSAIGNTPKIMKELLDANAATNWVDGTPEFNREPGLNALMQCAERGNKECVDLLLKAGVDVNMYSRDNKTALYLAAEKGHAEVVKALLNANANPNIPHRDNITPLTIAATKGHLETVKALAASAPLDTQDSVGATAVFEAASNRQHDSLKVLLDAHANPDLTSTVPGIWKNRTALIQAAQDGDLKSVELLLKRGAKVDLPDGAGKTAFMLAQERFAFKRNDLTDAERKEYEAILQRLKP